MADARTEIVNELDTVLRSTKRRDFLKLAALGGMGVFLPAVIAGCNDDPTNPSEKASFNVGSDVGLLNLAYAYTQLMADFYARVTANKYIGMTALENTAITAISGHKTNQRNTLQTAITAGRVSDALLFDFSSVDFSSRASVMGTAETLEDLGVAFINGAGKTFTDAKNLMLFGKLGSIWARAAATIRDLNDVAAGNGNNASRTRFAASATGGLDPATAPATVVETIKKYFKTTLSTSGT